MAPKISQLAFVFPNRRSGIFFQKYLAEVVGKPLFSPRVTTINDLLAELSPYTAIDRISLLVMLYKRYIELRQSDETFDNFVFWGDMLLGDFDDVDKYMVDARQLYTNIHDLKEIDEFYLTDEQIEIIKRFWGHLFFPSTESDNKQQFIQLWQILYDLYTRLRQDLADRNKAYEGMIFREVAERCRRKESLPTCPTRRWSSWDSTPSPRPNGYSWSICATRAGRLLLGLLRPYPARLVQQGGLLPQRQQAAFSLENRNRRAYRRNTPDRAHLDTVGRGAGQAGNRHSATAHRRETAFARTGHRHGYRPPRRGVAAAHALLHSVRHHDGQHHHGLHAATYHGSGSHGFGLPDATPHTFHQGATRVSITSTSSNCWGIASSPHVWATRRIASPHSSTTTTGPSSPLSNWDITRSSSCCSAFPPQPTRRPTTLPACSNTCNKMPRPTRRPTTITHP